MSCVPTVLDQELAKAMSFVAGFTEFAQEVSSVAYEAASQLCVEFGIMLDEQYVYLGRGLIHLTCDQLGEEAAEFVLRALNVVRDVAVRTFYAAPITAVSLLAPTWISTPLWIGYTIVHLAHDKPFSNQVYDNINTGMGNAFVVRAASAGGQFLATGNPVHAITSLISLAIAGVWHGKVPATDDPEGPSKGDKQDPSSDIRDEDRVEDVTGREDNVTEREELRREDKIDNVIFENNNVVLETGNEVLLDQ